MNNTPQETITQDREDFEAKFRELSLNSLGEDGCNWYLRRDSLRKERYAEYTTAKEWQLWQACAQLTRERQAKSGEAVAFLDYEGRIRFYGNQSNTALDLFPVGTKFYLAAPQQAIPAIDVNKMVDRFLGWKLPDNFTPDAGISFTKETHGHTFEPIGTNLFTAEQAKTMFEYCIHYQSDFNLEYTAIRIRRLLNALDISDPSNGNDNTLMGCLFSLLGQACRKLESAAPTAPIESDK
jgi:hypothetical protein